MVDGAKAPKLLHVLCSPRIESASSAAALAFLETFQGTQPSWEIDVLDLWREGLPEFNQDLLDGKDAVRRRAGFNSPQRDAWAIIEHMAVRFPLAERVLFFTPVWNFGLPYKLKHHIDLINQPRLTFRFDPTVGYILLLKDRPTLAIMASGGDFVTGMNRGRIDMATPYLREAPRFISVRSVEFVNFGPTVGPQEAIGAARQSAHRRLAELARRF